MAFRDAAGALERGHVDSFPLFSYVNGIKIKIDCWQLNYNIFNLSPLSAPYVNYHIYIADLKHFIKYHTDWNYVDNLFIVGSVFGLFYGDVGTQWFIYCANKPCHLGSVSIKGRCLLHLPTARLTAQVGHKRGWQRLIVCWTALI